MCKDQDMQCPSSEESKEFSGTLNRVLTLPKTMFHEKLLEFFVQNCILVYIVAIAPNSVACCKVKGYSKYFVET